MISYFQVFNTLALILNATQHVFLYFLVEKKEFHFSIRAQRVGTARNNWLKELFLSPLSNGWRGQ